MRLTLMFSISCNMKYTYFISFCMLCVHINNSYDFLYFVIHLEGNENVVLQQLQTVNYESHSSLPRRPYFDIFIFKQSI